MAKLFGGAPARITAAALLAGLLGLASGPGPALAQSLGLDHAAEYRACMELTQTVPDDAFESALAWADQGGGDAAEHCAAVALISLGHYEQAGQRLEQLAANLKSDYLHLRGEILAQAGQAWLLAGQLDRAHAAQSAALELEPDSVDLLLDRSVTLGAAANYWEAIDDLNRAAELAPQRADILVYRASAYRFVDALDLAREDVEQALVLAPDHPEALLERGNLNRLTGDDAAARADWVRVTVLAEGTPTADAAQANLERLDVKRE